MISTMRRAVQTPQAQGRLSSRSDEPLSCRANLAPRLALSRSVAAGPSLIVMRMTLGLLGRNPLSLAMGRQKKQPSPV